MVLFYPSEKIKPYLLLPENIWHKFENQIKMRPVFCKERLKTSCAEHRVTYCPLKQKEETCIPHSPYISVWFSLPRLRANHSVLCEQ